MTDRASQIAAFLDGTPWATWTSTPLAADASARRYLRLSNGAAQIILMDANPSAHQETQRFVDIANWLLKTGFSPPRILKAQTDRGLLLLEDLGRHDFANWIRTHPHDTTTLYTAATDELIALDRTARPKGLPILTPETGGEMLCVTCEWYAHSCDPTALTNAMMQHMGEVCGPPDRVALRDFHVENLIWRPQETGNDRVGLLDFQDALIAPRGYDLISLLRDVRRHVDPHITAKMTDRFIAAVQADPAQTKAALACLAVQRNLRILGVFARLARRDTKRRYLKWVPHVWTLIQEDLRHPALEALKSEVGRTLPPPNQSAIKDLL